MVDGVRWDSKKEYRRWQELWALKEAGRISHLRRQVRYRLVVNGVKVCSYVADFEFREGGRRVVEDVKSKATRKLPVYQLKRKLMRACHNIEVQEV